MPRPVVVPVSEIEPLMAEVRALGPGEAAAFDAFRTRAAEPDRSVGLADCFRVLRALSLRVGEETFRLSARPMMAGTAELVFSRAAGCATLGEAVREIAHAYNVLHGDAYNRVEQRGRTLAYVLDDERFPYTRGRDSYLHFSLECALIFLHSALCELADDDLAGAVRQVSTRRPGPAAETGALTFWDAPIVHDAGCYGLAYDAAVASRPLSRRHRHMPPDLAVHNRIISLIEAKEARGAREQVVAMVLRAFRDGLHEQGEIALRLGVSPATLRRRLAEEGASFRGLHHRLLDEQARVKLIELGDVGGVAESLGFSDTRSFTRAFKGWTGLTPSAYLAAERRKPQPS